MATIKPEFSEESVKFHYSLGRPCGQSDEEGVIEVPYRLIRYLKSAPQEDLERCRETPVFGDMAHSCQEFFIPQCGQTIIFICRIWDEKGYGPYAHDIDGPYLKTETPQKETLAIAVKNAAEEMSIAACPLCGNKLDCKSEERPAAAGDHVNEYKVATCPKCSYKKEVCGGGHCSDNPLSGWSNL